MDGPMKQQRDQLAQKFNACRPALCAIGDETRQLIIRVFIENCGAGACESGRSKGVRISPVRRCPTI